jgi:hypothetical protein
LRRGDFGVLRLDGDLPAVPVGQHDGHPAAKLGSAVFVGGLRAELDRERGLALGLAREVAAPRRLNRGLVVDLLRRQRRRRAMPAAAHRHHDHGRENYDEYGYRKAQPFLPPHAGLRLTADGSCWLKA